MMGPSASSTSNRLAGMSAENIQFPPNEGFFERACDMAGGELDGLDAAGEDFNSTCESDLGRAAAVGHFGVSGW